MYQPQSRKRGHPRIGPDRSGAVPQNGATGSPKRKASTCSDQIHDVPETSAPKRQHNPTVKYFCTSCALDFDNVIAWKSHHGNAHRREWKYLCPAPRCPAVFFSSEEFKRHHRNVHGCRRCVHTTSSQEAVSSGSRGYGCGICAQYLSSEDAYIEHVAAHWEAGRTRDNWYYSRVIYGLLCGPGVHEAWNQLIRTTYVDLVSLPVFAWNRLAPGEATIRNYLGASLQEALEMPHEIPGLSAADVVVIAHNTAIRIPRVDAMAWYADLTPEIRSECCLGFDVRLYQEMQNEWNRLRGANRIPTQRQQTFEIPLAYHSQQPQMPRGQQLQDLQPQPQGPMSAIPAGIQYLSPSPLFHQTNQQKQQQLQQPQQQHILSSPMHQDTPSTHYSSNGHVPQQVQQQCLPPHLQSQQHQHPGSGMFIDHQEQQQQPSSSISSGSATPKMQSQFTGFSHNPQQQTPSLGVSPDVASPNYVISPSTTVYQQDSQHQGQPLGGWIGVMPGDAGPWGMWNAMVPEY